MRFFFVYKEFSLIHKEKGMKIKFSFPFMELRGVEPRSEGTSIEASPITVDVLTFPQVNAQRQAYTISSFINLPQPQSLSCEGPHKNRCQIL